MARAGRDPGSSLNPFEQHATEAGTILPAQSLIRIGSREDIDAVYTLNEKVFPEAWSRKALSEVLSQGYELRVWNSADGRLCAYTLSRDTLDEVHILQLAVDPAFRRKGLAHRLTQRLLAEKRHEGRRLAYLEVRLSNTAAQALYTGLGFTVSGRRKNYYTPLPGSLEREDALLMSLVL